MIEKNALELYLGDMHPFTQRQSEAFELYINRIGYEKIAQILGISPSSVKDLIYGRLNYPDAPRSQIGVFGVVESITGIRPKSRNDLTMKLEGNIVFIRDKKNS